MAIYALKLGFISRSEGRSSVGFSAYIGGVRARDERTGVSFDYASKSEVIAGRVLAPRSAPNWVRDASILWNKVEAFEDEIANLRFQGGEKSQLAKEKFLNTTQTAQTVMGAIPLEFKAHQAEACVEDFLRQRFVSRDLIVDYAIHWSAGNPHFHALVTRRALKGDGFCLRKDREIVSKEEHIKTRHLWASVANHHLKTAGLDVRIDARSNADRGSFFEATMHEGWHAQRLNEKGLYSRIVTDNEEVRRRNVEMMLEKPEAIIHEVAHTRTTFTARHIEDEIMRRVSGDEKLFALLKDKLQGIEQKDVYESSDVRQDIAADKISVVKQLALHLVGNKKLVHKLGENTDRRAVYASKAYKQQEDSIRACANVLHGQRRNLKSEHVLNAIEAQEKNLGFSLSSEQRHAIHFLCKGPDLRLLVGKAGTGKTTLMKAVAKAYLDAGYTVKGAAFQGKVAEVMQSEIGIKCETIDSYLYKWQRYETYQKLVYGGKLWGKPYFRAYQKMRAYQKFCLTSSDVLFVDEANMVRAGLFEPLLKEAATSGAKVILVQDPYQIKPRDGGDIARMLADRYGYAETNTVIRQRKGWQKKASEKLNQHAILDGLQPYYERGHIKWLHASLSCELKLAQDYAGTIQDGKQIALAYTNKDVLRLNAHIREMLKVKGQLTETFQINGLEFALGDRIVFTQNDASERYVKTQRSFLNSFLNKGPGVRNGTFGTIVGHERGYVTVQLDDKREVQFNTKNYAHLARGYAISIHKAEGSTFDRTYLLASRYMDPSTTLVGMTRHRDNVTVYVSTEQFVDFKDLVDTLSKGHMRETLDDYNVSKAQQPYLDRIKQYKDLIHETAAVRAEIEGDLEPSASLSTHPSYQGYKTFFHQRKALATLVLQDWKNHAPFARLAGLRKDVLEVEADFRERHLSHIEQKAHIQMDIYKAYAANAKSLWREIQKTHPAGLASKHSLYEDYKAYKNERDSLAYCFVERAKLYKPLLWDKEHKGDVSWRTLQMQAKMHVHAEGEKATFRSLSPHEKEVYTLCREYAFVRNEAAALYSHMKGRGRESDDRDVHTKHAFKEAQCRRDSLALQIISLPAAKKTEDFFTRFNIRAEKLFKQASHAEIRRYVERYRQEKSIEEKTRIAAKLQRSVTAPDHFRVLREEGFNPKQIQPEHKPQKRHAHARIEDLLRQKAFDYRSLAQELLGAENKTLSTQHTLRFGRKGSMAFHLTGDKAGLWHDFESNKGGNALQLIQHVNAYDAKTAAEHLLQRSGSMPEARAQTQHKDPKTVDEALNLKRVCVQNLFEKSKPAQGTVVARYLSKTRCIKGTIPDDLRLLQKGTIFQYNGEQKELFNDCLAAFARNAKGQLQAVQLTQLTPSGERAKTAQGDKWLKAKYGLGKGAFAMIQQLPSSKTVIIAEGVETALSLKEAGAHATIVAAQGISNIKNYAGPESRIVIAGDNDTDKATERTSEMLRHLKQHFMKQGKTVLSIQPTKPGHDFNDVLKEQGAGGVRAFLKGIGPYITKEKSVSR